MNLLEINRRIKQRPPFQMIERVTEWEPNQSATGIKGVLLIESAAQLCSLVFEPENAAADETKLSVLLKVKDFKFLRPVIPGDKLTIHVSVVRATAAASEFSALISVDGEPRAKGNLLFTTIDRSVVYDG